MTNSRLKGFLTSAATYLSVVAGTLLLIDGICILFGLFPPTHNYGDPDLGWRSANPTGHMSFGQCTEFSTGAVYRYARNEDGVRTSRSKDSLMVDSTHIRIGATGDSQTDLCAPNELIHAGVLESTLISDGIPAEVMTFGSGRYSPLQAYLAFRQVLRPYRPAVLVLNVYTGNDFYDILRVDDRPHFVAVDSGYSVAGPVWFSLDDPSVKSRSRVLFAFRSIADKLGVRGLYFRMTALRQLGAQQGGGMSTVLAYMRDLWKAREPSVGYSDAFSAQILNQQLFFKYFPKSEDESIHRMRALLRMIRQENTSMLLVLSPLPSYELTNEQPVDSALLKTLKRVNISVTDGIREEGALYEQLRTLAAQEGWLFVDNLAALQRSHGPDRLYNDFDYHLLPAASAIIGRAQAAALLDTLARMSRR